MQSSLNFTIAIPSYNAEHRLPKVLESLQTQVDIDDLLHAQDSATGEANLPAFAKTWDDSKEPCRAICQCVPLPPTRYMQPPFHQVVVPHPLLTQRMRLASDRDHQLTPPFVHDMLLSILTKPVSSPLLSLHHPSVT